MQQCAPSPQARLTSESFDIVEVCSSLKKRCLIVPGRVLDSTLLLRAFPPFIFKDAS